MVFIVAICSETVLLIIARVAGDFFIGMNLFHVGRDLLVDDRGRGAVAGAGTIIVIRHDGQR